MNSLRSWDLLALRPRAKRQRRVLHRWGFFSYIGHKNRNGNSEKVWIFSSSHHQEFSAVTKNIQSQPVSTRKER